MLLSNQFKRSCMNFDLYANEVYNYGNIVDKIPKFLKEIPPHLILIYSLGMISGYFFQQIYDRGDFDPLLKKFGLERDNK